MTGLVFTLIGGWVVLAAVAIGAIRKATRRGNEMERSGSMK